ncbi:hypothetical protein D3C81_2223870 [compost metagenome]
MGVIANFTDQHLPLQLPFQLQANLPQGAVTGLTEILLIAFGIPLHQHIAERTNARDRGEPCTWFM